MERTWESMSQQTEFGDALFTDDVHEFRGPLRRICFEGETVRLVLDWVAFRRLGEELWRPWRTTNTFYAMKDRRLVEDADGLLHFHSVMVAKSVILPVAAGRLERPRNATPSPSR